MDNDTIIQQLATINTRLESQEKDIKILYKKCEELSNSNNSNYVAIQTILVKLDNMSGKIDDLAKNVNELSSKPAKNWDNVVKNVITGVISALIGIAFAKWGLK